MKKYLILAVIAAVSLGLIAYNSFKIQSSNSPISFGASVMRVIQGGTGASTLTGCLEGNGTSPITGTGSPCGSGGGGGSGGGAHSTSTAWGSTLYVRPNNATDIYALGYDGSGVATSSNEAEYVADPVAKIASYLNGMKLGIGTTSPYAALSVVGQIVGEYFTGTSTTATSTIPNLSGVLDASAFSGADMCAKINAAYLALPSNGGKITVPTGRYDCTTPIVFGTNNKVVILSGAGHGGPIGPYPAQIGGTTIYYSPSTGAAITVNTNYSNAQSVIENISIQGSNGTSARTSKGVVFGGANGAFGGTLRDVHVSGFGYGVYYDSYTSFNVIDSSTIDFNGKNIYEPDTAGANGENMRIINSVIADSNNQSGGATSLYCVEVQESGNVQWNVTNTSFDDCSWYSNQYGGTGNINTFTNTHWENPNLTTYQYVQTLSNVDGVVFNFIGGDMMNDATGGLTEFIYNGGHINIQGMSFTTNYDVSVPTTRVVTNQNATAVNTVSWSGAQETNAGVTYMYGTVPFSPQGYGTGLAMGPTFTIGLPTSTQNGTTTIANLAGTLDASSFNGTDIGVKINAAYAALPPKGGIIKVPRGYFEYSTMIDMSTNGKRALLQGAPGGGTELRWNGTATSTKINWGIQASGIDHTSGCGIRDITFKGSSYATSTSPQTGIDIGGANGSDCTVFENVNIQEFGRGLYGGANVYHFAWYNGVIRANGNNILIDTANNSGEGYNFFNPFIIDGYATYGEESRNCFVLSDYAAATVSIFGGSINSCQVNIGLQMIQFNMHGTHMENPSASWPKYTYIKVAESAYSNLNLHGVLFFNGLTSRRPDAFIESLSASVSLFGVSAFNNGTQVPLLVDGFGKITWSGFNNTNGGVTNITTGYAVTSNGANALSITNLGSLGIASSTPWKQLSIGSSNVGTFAISTSTSGCASFSPFGELYSTGTACGSGVGSGSSKWATSTVTSTSIHTAGATNVGIGTTTPRAPLHVGSSYLPRSATPFTNNNPVAIFGVNADEVNGVAMSNINTGTNADFRFIIQDTTDHYVAFGQPGINNNQSNLFGQTRPSADFIFNNGGTARNLVIGSVSAKDLIFGTNNTENMRIVSGGNIGIATSTPVYHLTSFSSTAPQLSLSAGGGLAQWTFRNAGGNFYLATTTVAGTATTTTSAFSIIGATGEVATRFLSVLTKFVGVIAAAFTPSTEGEMGIDTTSNQFKYFSGGAVRVVSPTLYPAFTYATSTAYTGTTTIPLGPSFVAETWTGVQCFTDAGTVNVSFYDGTNRMNMFNASTTVGTVTLSSNNSFTAGEKRYVDIGTPASSPTKVSCTLSKTIDAN